MCPGGREDSFFKDYHMSHLSWKPALFMELLRYELMDKPSYYEEMRRVGAIAPKIKFIKSLDYVFFLLK